LLPLLGLNGVALRSKMSSFSALQKSQSFIFNNLLASLVVNNIFFRWCGDFCRCSARSPRLAAPFARFPSPSLLPITSMIGYDISPGVSSKKVQETIRHPDILSLDNPQENVALGNIVS
jgi:hypothetical protein